MTVLLKGGQLLLDGSYSRCDILIREGVVAGISPDISETAFDLHFNLNNCFVFRALQMSTSICVSGFSYKETIETGTLAAARRGYTAVCAMPNTKPVPDSVETLAVMRELIERSARVKVFPYASITKGERAGSLWILIALLEAWLPFRTTGAASRVRS